MKNFCFLSGFMLATFIGCADETIEEKEAPAPQKENVRVITDNSNIHSADTMPGKKAELSLEQTADREESNRIDKATATNKQPSWECYDNLRVFPNYPISISRQLVDDSTYGDTYNVTLYRRNSSTLNDIDIIAQIAGIKPAQQDGRTVFAAKDFSLEADDTTQDSFYASMRYSLEGQEIEQDVTCSVRK